MNYLLPFTGSFFSHIYTIHPSSVTLVIYRPLRHFLPVYWPLSLSIYSPLAEHLVYEGRRGDWWGDEIQASWPWQSFNYSHRTPLSPLPRLTQRAVIRLPRGKLRLKIMQFPDKNVTVSTDDTRSELCKKKDLLPGLQSQRLEGTEKYMENALCWKRDASVFEISDGYVIRTSSPVLSNPLPPTHTQGRIPSMESNHLTGEE